MMLIWLCIGWVFAATAVAVLPMRRQYIPGVLLLVAAPVLIVLIGLQYGWIFAALACAAFVSMFRNPLRYLFARLRGERPEIPK